MHHHHNNSLVILSVVIAIFSSYTALDLVNSLSTSRGKIKWMWLSGGSLAMGVGIWSMHFIGMLAFKLPGLDIYYDVPLLILSIVVAIFASFLALFIVSSRQPSIGTYVFGSLIMGTAIAGMHYIGIASMRVSAEIHWDYFYVVLSILIAFAASFGALLFAFKFRADLTLKGFMYRGLGGILMGFAIAGMHYTAMAGMHFEINDLVVWTNQQLLATDGLAAAVIIGTLIVLGVALSGSNVDRALSKKSLVNEVLQEGIRTRDEFLSIASHELKTPLTSAKLQLQMLIRQLSKQELDKDRIVEAVRKTDVSIDDRFERATISPTEISGLGLGLFIVKEIIQAHQGRIRVESEFKKGSTFIVELPLCPAPLFTVRTAIPKIPP